MEPDAVEIRVLGCLIEKQRTTPDVYPLTLNALRLACNQSTNRDPVVDYDEATIRAALDRLARKNWTRLASGPGSRAVKFRHLFDEALKLSDEEISLSSSPSASSNKCRNFTARLPGPLARRAHPRRLSESSARRIVGSSYSTTGSRFVDWLHASRSEFSVSG